MSSSCIDTVSLLGKRKKKEPQIKSVTLFTAKTLSSSSLPIMVVFQVLPVLDRRYFENVQLKVCANANKLFPVSFLVHFCVYLSFNIPRFHLLLKKDR